MPATYLPQQQGTCFILLEIAVLRISQLQLSLLSMSSRNAHIDTENSLCSFTAFSRKLA
jgi:hypothetical protein